MRRRRQWRGARWLRVLSAPALLLGACDDPHDDLVGDTGVDAGTDIAVVDLGADVGNTEETGFVVHNLGIAEDGSLDALPPSTPFTLTYEYQAWNAATCDGCDLQLVVFVADAEPTDCAFAGAAAVYPGESGVGSLSFVSPATPGTYDISADVQDESDCAAAINDIVSEGDERRVVGTITVVEPVEVVLVDPADESEGVDIDTTIVVTFSREVDPESLRSGATVDGPNGPVAGRWLGSGTVLTFQPDQLLAEGRTEYDVDLTSAVVSVGSPAPLLPFDFSFTTQMVSDDFAYALTDEGDEATSNGLGADPETGALALYPRANWTDATSWVFEELPEDAYRISTIAAGGTSALTGGDGSGPALVGEWDDQDDQIWHFSAVPGEDDRFYLWHDGLGADWVLGLSDPPTMISIDDASEEDSVIPVRGESVD